MKAVHGGNSMSINGNIIVCRVACFLVIILSMCYDYYFAENNVKSRDI